MTRLAAALAACACLAGCSQRAATAIEAEANAREQRLKTTLEAPASDEDANLPVAKWLLPPVLREISGLALTANGRLFAHGDERGVVWEVDYRRGVLLKSFALGRTGVKADFEGLTVAGSLFVMMASDGTLYEFPEGTNGSHVDYQISDPKLSKECEFEGVAFEASSQSLLLACKHVKAKNLNGMMVIYRVRTKKGDVAAPEPIVVPLAQAIGDNGWKSLHPSDITIDPKNGHYVLIASQERALIEVTPTGEVVSSRPLPGEHLQAEGVAITRDGLLLVSDEATRESASLTAYRWRPGSEPKR